MFRASNYAQPINGYKNANINKNAKKWKKFFVYYQVKRQPHEENLKFKNKNKENEILSI